MTRKLQKARERSFVEEAAKHIGAAWDIEDGERPDFIIVEGAKKFGLEVTQIFTGQQNRSGATMKTGESTRLKRIDALRRAYQATHDVPLWVRFTGRLSEETLANVTASLVAIDFPSKPQLHEVTLDEGKGLRVQAVKACRPVWHYTDDSRGWVDRAPQRHIENAIRDKAEKLPQYRSAAGNDVRLLIVADRLQNSGKLTLQGDAAFDLQGFQKVYFFSRPEYVIDLEPL